MKFFITVLLMILSFLLGKLDLGFPFMAMTIMFIVGYTLSGIRQK